MKMIKFEPAPNKECGACSMCCKLFAVDWLDRPKPAGAWCHHCTPGKGCAIWERLPAQCGSYFCVWRIDPMLGDEWRPDRARFILSNSAENDLLVVVNDPSHPDAHRRAPYFAQLRKTAAAILEGHGSTIVVFNGRRRTLLMPDGEVPVPDALPLNRIKLEAVQAPGGKIWRAIFPAG